MKKSIINCVWKSRPCILLGTCKEFRWDIPTMMNERKINIGPGSIFCVLEKVEQKWWKKLLRGDEKIHYVNVDWDKWVDEDDVDDFSKFGDMGLDDDAIGDDLEESDDEDYYNKCLREQAVEYSEASR
ncbi:co-chaperone protein p23-1-like isoform X2 [Salvia hispanica]|uniref:co-chaperone protein p23-1-like isoform X2 n=1 Tax=Salvia hispanica TaxID=49212 RepID=UPI0020095A5A|nr:co-chaperone protein p23-1-like isoform X2 [Salvia hispanica]